MSGAPWHRLRSAALVLAIAAGAACARPPVAPAPVPKIAFSAARPIVIAVDDDAMAADRPVDPMTKAERRAEDDRRRVRASVLDLARVLREISGATVTVSSESVNGAYPILVGERARRRFGDVGRSALWQQGFRVVAAADAAGVFGESGLGTSYAIYELLDRLGCRWFFPGALGEVLPHGPVELAAFDEASAPSTDYRAVWYADEDWKRRNRQGGLKLEAAHALEISLVTADDRKAHPDWIATVHGKPDPVRLRWSSRSLADHVAAKIAAAARRPDGAASYSISPDDGADFDESAEDRALDTGDLDPTTNRTALADRFLVLANRIASGVAPEAPDVLLGFIAYVQYTQPPRREHLAPSLVPQLAPITYARAHPMDDDRVPDNVDLRRAVEGWGKLAAHGTSMYCFGWFLADPVAPNPMLTKWGHDLPYLFSHGVRFWQPETFPNFETSLHGLYLGMRLAFDARKKPADVFADLDAKLYGAAGPAMHAYWKAVDDTWIATPEYSGGAFGQARRFPPERIAKLRALLEAGKSAARTEAERRRVELADDSLGLFETQMTLRRALDEGRWDGLDDAGAAYRKRVALLGAKWKESFAFGRTDWAPDTIYAQYFDAMTKPALGGAAKIAREDVVDALVRRFRWQRVAAGDVTLGPEASAFSDGAWPSTDVAVDSWSALGLHDWFGGMWYRATVTTHRPPAEKRAFVWLAAADGDLQVWLNGRAATFVPEPGGPKTTASAGSPLRFDVTDLVTEGDNVLAVRAMRKDVTELGVSGLMGPVAFVHEK